MRARTIAGLLAIGTTLAAALAAGAAPAAAKTVVNPATDRALIEEYAGIEAAKLGASSGIEGGETWISLPGGRMVPIELKESPSKTIKTPIGPAVGTTLCRDGAGGQSGPTVGCVVELAVLPHSNGELRDTVAHEVFHAFEAVMAGTLANFNRPENDWLVEGAAEWVESSLNKNDRAARYEWTRYLRSPATVLFTRTYSAVGFFGHMVSSGISPWSRFKAMFAATSAPGSWAAGTGGDLALLDSEASGFFLDPALGSPWYERDNNVPSRGEVHLTPPVVSVTSTSKTKPLGVRAYADGVYELSIGRLSAAEPLLEVRARSGFVRLHSTAGSHVDAVVSPALTLCGGTAKQCSCPKHPTHFPQMTRGDLAITGGSAGGAVELVRRKTCEELLGGVPCQTLLPGFSTEVSEGIAHAVGEPSLSATAGSPTGSTASDCAFLTKGTAVPGGEFVGVIAPLVAVLRASSIAGAIRYYEIVTRVAPAGYVVSHPAVGDEALLATKGPPVAAEYSSEAFVRVQNIVAEFTLVSTPGNTEANPAESLRMLYVVAGRL